jgi:hypothetical protein
MPEWTGKHRQGWLRTFLVDMDKNAGLHVELESDRLGVDDEPEGQESSAITPGSVEQQTDQRVDVPPSGAGVRSTNQRNARRGRISPGNRNLTSLMHLTLLCGSREKFAPPPRVTLERARQGAAVEAWHRTILRRRWRRSNRHSHFEDEKHRRIVDLDVVGSHDLRRRGQIAQSQGLGSAFAGTRCPNMERRIFYIVVLRRWVAKRPPLCPRTAKWPPLLGAGL